MAKQKFGLRAAYIPLRVETARGIVHNLLLTGQFSKTYSAGNQVFARYPLFYSHAETHNRFRTPVEAKEASFGGFGINHGNNVVGVVEIPKRGKPIVHIQKEHELLGRAISKAFKDHARYLFFPAVRVKLKLSSVEDVLAPKQFKVHAKQNEDEAERDADYRQAQWPSQTSRHRIRTI